MPSLRRSLSITFLASNGATAVNFLVTIVLARLLTPAENGIFSIAYVLVSVAHIFRRIIIGVNRGQTTVTDLRG
jgi:O-antigen/teichoic acid export membrane protein